MDLGVLYVDSHKNHTSGRGIQTSPGVLIRGTQEERIIEEILLMWRTMYRQEYKDFIVYRKAFSEIQARPSGMSNDGNLMIKADIPTRPYILVGKYMRVLGHEDWWGEKDSIKKFTNIFKASDARLPK